jgi:hypothetical protein
VAIFRDLMAAVGVFLIVTSAWSVIGTVVVPRKIRSWLPRVVFQVVNGAFHTVADRFDSYETRDRVLAAQTPVQLIVQIAAWLAAFELGFGLLIWPLGGTGGLVGALEQIGSSLCTLGYLSSHASAQRALDDLAALVGLGTVALEIGYLPAMYAAFNRRESLITMLDSRAGVPSWGPELLARTHYGLGSGVSAVGELPQLFEDWERWSADVSESHSTYLPLINLRSPAAQSSWVTAQLAVLDAAALYLSLLANPPRAITARLCLRGGFTCLANVARALDVDIALEADPSDGIELTYGEFVEALDRLRAAEFPIERSDEDAWDESAAYALARAVDAPPALWSGSRRRAMRATAPHRPLTRRAPRREPRATSGETT